MKLYESIHRMVSFMLVTAVIMTVAGGCVEELDGGIEDGQEQEYLAFSTRLSDEATKAAPMTMLSGNAGVIGYVYDTWPADADAIKKFAPWTELEKRSFTFDGDQLEVTEGMVKWSAVGNTQKSKLKVYAYAPETLPVSYETDGNYTLPSITYTVPTDISKQTDITSAVAEVSTGFRKNIPLTFDHILTGIKFKAGFDCTVKSITISNVASAGTYTMGEGWNVSNTVQNYTISFGEGKTVSTGDMITDDADGNILFMIPQRFAANSSASVTLKYDNDQTITTSLAGKTWEEGRMITYTLHKTDDDDSSSTKTIYFDLAAGNVTINGTSYTGKIYVGGQAKEVNGTHVPENRYYVYQSSELKTKCNKLNTGYASDSDYNNKKNCRIPEYDPVMVGDTLWRDWITNNQVVEDIIEYWDNGANIREDRSAAPGEKHTDKAVVRDAGREHTRNYIQVTGSGKYNLTIDNLYSTYQTTAPYRTTGGITFIPEPDMIAELTLNIVGDNRFGNIHFTDKRDYTRAPHDLYKLILEGDGSLTVADVDFYVENSGYYSNHHASVIGGDDAHEDCNELIINSGTIYVGSTKAENCSAIGGGGNGNGVITINGGTVTAVATTTGTAIGGGIGFTYAGGSGTVTINGGNVYAYNLANQWNIPSAAIGGAGSKSSIGNTGSVNIKGGNIYAQTALGTAIGGGSSKEDKGGNANVTITGGSVVAKSLPVGNIPAGAGIGGGTGGSNSGANGGSATVTISGNPIIRTGSIGGGKTNNSTGKIGSATINISGGDIQAQFVMAAGSGSTPTFTMTGGLIRNSDTDDLEYIHLQKNGGAVYLEDGKFTMSGGKIRQCRAEKGGAIYIEGTAGPEFNMTGGTITQCAAETDGGAVYLQGGTVNMSGGIVSHNLANNGNGGGFCIVGGDFTMDDTGAAAGNKATISENAAFSQNKTGGTGGGIYVTSAGSVDVSILSGSITENSSDRVGGGLAVDMADNDTATASVTVGKSKGGKENPLISNNHTIIMGGGLYAKGTNANITINSGKIKNNTISGYVSNPDVANEEGSVTLNGGDVTHVTVTYNNNAKFLGLQESYVDEVTQDIVTATKSRMVVSKQFSMPQHTFNGWNTRPDGKGTQYEDGAILNLKTDLTLYAQWKKQ